MAGKMFYAAAVVLLDIAAAAAIVSSITSDTTEAEFASAMEQGADLESRQLYGRAINAYSAAEGIHDSIDLRLKVADLYGKGYENGEFGTLELRQDTLRSIIKDYNDDERVLEAYDGLAEIFTNDQNYESLAGLVKYAKNSGKQSDTLTKAYEDVRHRFNIATINVDSLESVGPYWIGWKDIYSNDSDKEEDPDENKLRSFTLFYENGEKSTQYQRIEMSAPTEIRINENTIGNYYFVKIFGNDSETRDENDKVYSAIYRDGVRITYLNGDYRGWYQFGSGMISLYNKNTKKWDIYDYNGEIKNDGYDTAGTFGNGYMFVERGEKSRIINTEFKDIFGEDMLAVTGFGGRCSINNRMFLKKKGESKYTLYDSTGGTPSAMNFSCDDADLFIENVAAFSENGKWGFVDNSGNVVIEPKYEEAKSFRNGFAAVKENDKWGFINESGEMILEPQFEDALYFIQNGSAFVKNNEGYCKLTLFYTEEVSDDGTDQE